MEKLLKQDQTSFDVTRGITIEEFNDKYNKIPSWKKPIIPLHAIILV